MKTMFLICASIFMTLAFAEDVTFQGVFNDIANAIIEKDGGAGMTPAQMPGRISNIPSGLSVDALNRSNMTNYIDNVAKTNGSIVGRVYQLENNDTAKWNLHLETTESLPSSSYRGAYNLESVSSIPNAEITIGSKCFAYLPNLKEVVIPKCKSVSADAFYGSSVEKIVLSNSTMVSGVSLTGLPNLKYLDLDMAGGYLSSWSFYSLTRKLDYLSLRNISNSGNLVFNDLEVEELGDFDYYNPDLYLIDVRNMKRIGILKAFTNNCAHMYYNCDTRVESIGRVREGVARFLVCRKFGEAYCAQKTKIYALDIPCVTNVNGLTWDIASNKKASETQIGRLNVRLGAVSACEGFNQNWQYVFRYNNDLGAILINRNRNEFLEDKSRWQYPGFSDYQISNHIIFADDQEWETWNTWFEGGCDPDDYPGFPLNR